MHAVPVTSDDLSVDWLTAALRQNTSEHVVARSICQLPHHSSDQVFRVELQWSSPTAPELPRSVIIKLGSSNRSAMGARELEVYWNAAMMPDRLLPQAYYLRAETPPSRYVMVLEDLAATHRTIPPQLPPTQHEAEQMITALARCHAQWWNHPRLVDHAREDIWQYDHLRRHRFALTHLPQLIAALGERATASALPDLERLLQSQHEWWRQRSVRDPENTLLHGDAHALNFLLPLDAAGTTFLIDWNPLPYLPCVGPASLDLALLMIPYWTQSRRRQLEEPLLRFYHDAICQAGVKNYSWEQLWADYGRAAVMQIHGAIDLANSEEPAGWYLQWERVWAAIDDLAAWGAFQ